MGPRAAYVVLILRNVGQVREIAEGADDLNGRQTRQAGQDHVQFGARALILVAVEANRGLADTLDKFEDRFALLSPHSVAQHTPEQANVIPQRHVFVAAVIPDRGTRRQTLLRCLIWLAGLSLCILRALFAPGHIGRRIRGRTGIH